LDDTTHSPFERRSVLHAAVDIASPQEFLDYLIGCVDARTGRSVVGISAPYATAMSDSVTLRDAFLKADVLIPDGKGFVWGARCLGVPCGDRFAIPDVCEQLLKGGDARKWKVFVYGATREVNAAAIANIQSRFPNLAAIAGQHGYDQDVAAEDAIIARLRDERFNLVIVARPSPDKEYFLARCCKTAGVVGLAAGGYADILAGTKQRAPGWVQALGMEWFYRLIQDPAHLWKRIGWANMRFAGAVAWSSVLGVPRRAWFAQPHLHVVAIVAIVLLAYWKSLGAPYHFDDPEYILRNTAIRSLSTVNEITITAHRKIWWYSNAVSYAMQRRFGNFDPAKPERPDVRYFRAWNIGCHMIAALALFGLLRRCLKSSRNCSEGDDEPDVRPFVAAAIFAAHPLCTEAVTYISGRDNGMGGMFYVLGLYCAAVAFERMGFSAPKGSRSGRVISAPMEWPGWFWPAVFALGFGACAVLTKESHLTFPAAVALVWFCFYRCGESPTLSLGLLTGMIPALGVLAWGAAGRYDGSVWFAVPFALGLLTLGGLLGSESAPESNGEGLRLKRLGVFQKQVGAGWAFLVITVGLGAVAILAFPYAYSRTIGALTGYQGSSSWRSLCTQAYAVPMMLSRAIFPVSITTTPDFNITQNLNIDHQFPTISSLSDVRAITGLAVIVALVVFGCVGAFRGWLASFGVLLALIAIAPTNTVIERGDVVSERNFYLAAAGGACVIAWIAQAVALGFARRIERVDDAPKTSRHRHDVAREAALWTIILASCLIGPFVAFTTLRNIEWGDPYRLWRAAMDRSPDKMRVLYNFGVSAQDSNNSDEAEVAFTRAIAIGEDMSKRGAFRPDEAVDVKCFHLAYSRLAEIHLQRYVKSNKEDIQAVEAIKKIYDGGLNRTAWDPDLAASYASVLIKLGMAPQAAPMLHQSLNLHTWADQLFLPLGVAHLELGEFSEAVKFLELASKLKNEHTLGYSSEMAPEYRAHALSVLGVARMRMNQMTEAKVAFREALLLSPESVLRVLTVYNAPRNIRLTPVQTQDPDHNAISVVRRDILLALRDAVNGLLASPPVGMPSNIGELKKLFDYELERRDAYQKMRIEKGFKDNPDDELK